MIFKFANCTITGGLDLSDAEILNKWVVKAMVEPVDGLFNLFLEHFVCTFNHFVVSHHVIVETGLYNILRNHSADFSAFIQERKIWIIVKIKVSFLIAWLSVKGELGDGEYLTDRRRWCTFIPSSRHLTGLWPLQFWDGYFVLANFELCCEIPSQRRMAQPLRLESHMLLLWISERNLRLV